MKDILSLHSQFFQHFVCFVFFFVFQAKIKFPIYLSQRAYFFRKKFRGKYGRRDKFSRRREKTVTETEKLVVYLQKNGKIIVSVTLNSVAPL